MHIHIHLHGHLRDVLPASAKGKTTLTLAENKSVEDVIEQLGLSDQVVLAAVNEAYESDLTQVLQDGDMINFFTMVAGGAGSI